MAFRWLKRVVNYFYLINLIDHKDNSNFIWLITGIMFGSEKYFYEYLINILTVKMNVKFPCRMKIEQ